MRNLITSVFLFFSLCTFGQSDSSLAITCYDFTSIWEHNIDSIIRKSQHIWTEIGLLDTSVFVRETGKRDTLILYTVCINFKKEEWKSKDFLRSCWTSEISKFYEVEISYYDSDEYSIGVIEEGKIQILRRSKHFIYLKNLITWKETIQEEIPN